MKTLARLIAWTLIAAIGPLHLLQADEPDLTAAQRVDALFSAWDKPDMPGCAVAIYQDGAIIYRHGFGLADIEHGAPILPSTPFHVASMSKQFTAFAIHLLAREGKLSLDDDVRKYLPELPDYGKTITIRHLLHHTSGLRDQWNLLAMAGWRLDDVLTEEDIFTLVTRQKGLNFAPGKKELYSNTGYTLLGIIVKRVSGKPLPEFAEERIFAPLGMVQTRFHDEYGTLVKGRALSYMPDLAGGYRYVALSYSNVGATSLFTTVEDLALWDENFYSGQVGGKELLAEMQIPGTLTNGKATDYASGLAIDTYRGLKTVSHSGGDAGYRTEMVRFPDQHFTVAILANAGNLKPTELAYKVADIYLDKQFTVKPAAPDAATATPATPAEVALDPAQLDALVGDYALSPQFVITFTKENGRLMAQATGQSKIPLFAAGERDFFAKAVNAQFSFDAPDKDGVVQGGVLHQNGRDLAARRIARTELSAALTAAYEGEFYSDELRALYTVTARDGKIMLRYPRGEIALNPVAPDVFKGSFPIGLLRYHCLAGKGCSGFSLSNGRVRGLQFTKVAIVTPAMSKSGKSGVFLPASSAVVMSSPMPLFAYEPFYLRGTMNDWGVRDRMRRETPTRYVAKIPLDKGSAEFKVGSEDFETIDFGAFPHDESARLGASKSMDAEGENIVIEIPERAIYAFVLDIRKPTVPKLTVTRMSGPD